MPPNALLRWSMEPADCTSLRQVEAGALHKAKTDEWLSDIQVQASGVGGGVSQDPACSVPSFLSLVLMCALRMLGNTPMGFVLGLGEQQRQGSR